MIWAKGMRRYLDDRLPSLWLGSMNRQLIKCSNGEELIIRISCTMDRWLGMETDIIDGSTGHHIFAIKVPQTTLQHVLPHPNTSQVIMVSEISSCPTTSAATCRLLSRFRVFSIRRFLYEPGTDLRILYAEALLMDTNKISADQKAIAVDPCRLTAVVGYEQLVPEVGLPQWALTSYPLVLTDNVELKGAAQAALRAKSLYAGAHANVRIQRCYFLGQARKTILPPNEGNQSLLVGVGQNWLHQGQNWLHRRQGQFVAIANPVHTRPEFYTESAAMSFT
ncbi:hypothetical protein BJY04DRAFT_54152 [Aspergillus karnatakaensis]|uniref:uncharacterized protein n=1 Tax=Aspergillus karnatakaensis TaxID=1810916 RepID=UPI003CCD0F2C